MSGEAFATAAATLAALALLRWCVQARWAAPIWARLPAPPRAALTATAPPPWFVARLRDCGLEVDDGTAWLAFQVIPIGAGALGLVSAGPALGLVAFATAVASMVLGATLRSAQGAERIGAAVAPFLESTSSSMRSGAGLTAAIREAAADPPRPLTADLAVLSAELDAGQALADCLDRWMERTPVAEVRLATVALGIAAAAGGSSARAVDGVAATIRARRAASDEARALGTQARLSAGIIAVAPIGFAVLAAGADPRTGRFLTGSALGLSLLTAGLVLDGLGWWWMSRITRRVA